MSQTPPGFNPKSFFDFNWNDIKARGREALVFLPNFLKNPVDGIKRAPSWDWPTVIILEIIVAVVTSFFGGIISRHILSIFGNIIVGPIMGLILSFIIAGLFYYACLFWMKTELEFRKVFVVVVLAKVPSQILGILSPVARPITLICIVLTCFLLFVGLIENFMLERKKVLQIVIGLGSLAILFWLTNTVMDATSNRIRVQDYTPESLDQIHKELNEGK